MTDPDPQTVTGEVVHGNVRLAYRLDGPPAAPVLVLSNSLGTSMALWDDLVPGLTSYFRVLRYDLRGHGGSSAPDGPYSIADLGGDLLALLDALAVGRASICGISLGGMVAMWLGSTAPERVDRLVLACTAPVLGPASAWDERAATVRAQGPGALVEVLVGRWFPPGFGDRHQSEVERVREMIGKCDPEGYAACCEAIGAMDQRDVLHRISAPTLVISGADDPVTPPSTGLALATALEGSSLCVLSGAAHLANLSQPERFLASVLDHLAGGTTSRGMAVRREVLGDAHVDRAGKRATSFTEPFQDLITRYAWGEVWSRPGLDRRTRSAITIAMLVALGRTEELTFHLPAALRNGLSLGEIQEVLLQTAVYAGVPAANSAFALANEVLGSDGPAPS